MAPKVSMVAPHLTVLMDDGAVYEVQATNRDLLQWERTRQRKYGTPQDAQIQWMTFLAWNALVREGQIPAGMTVDEFEDRCDNVAPVAVETDPTPGVPEAV